eukprot:10105220-Alexandrium_andersonii.AAC.1
MSTRQRRSRGISRRCGNCWVGRRWARWSGTCAVSGCGSPSPRIRASVAHWSRSQLAGPVPRRRC